MDLTQSFDSETFHNGPSPDTEELLVTNISYVVEEEGHVVNTPVLYLRGRRADGSTRTVEVEGFRPYFGIHQDDAIERIQSLCNDQRILGIEINCAPVLWADALHLDEPEQYRPQAIADHLTEQLGADIYHTPTPFQTIHDDPLALVYTRVPGDVGGEGGMRGDLDCVTFEADIPFERRFAISTEIYRGVEVPVGERRVRYENWDGEQHIREAVADTARGGKVQDIMPCEPPDIDARMIVYDIEVATEGDGFPDPALAFKPITAIAAYDNYDDEYRLWGLVHDSWRDDTDTVETQARSIVRKEFDCEPASFDLYHNETEMLAAFHSYVLERNPDIFTGWNAGGQGGGFDTPYLIQRSYNVQAHAIREYSETGNPATWVEERGGERTHDFILQDICTLDLFDAYKKTQFRALDSYKLDDVAEAELGFGKLGLSGDELDEAWAERPETFFAYNLRDTQATAGIERESGLLDLFENLREVTGAAYETAVNNGPMLDTLFLRRAYEKGLALPSNTAPDEDVYHGAKVFNTEPGVHPNCVYPDLSSLYPNLFAMLNLGGETIVGDEEALTDSEYVRGDCYRFPVDERPFATVPKGESIDHVDRNEYKGVKTPDGDLREIFEPDITWFYVLKPDVKESFIRDTVDDLIDLKYRFSGSMYEAVKRVTNSVYGIAGDSSSGGVGFRLYNRRVAEGITLAGRMTITHTAEEFTDYLRDNYDEDALLVGGDTDSSTTSIPNAPTLNDAWEWSMEAVEYVDESYDEFAAETFEMDPDDHRLAVELESLASALFYMEGDADERYEVGEDGYLRRETDHRGVRKKYAQHIVWDDDDGWLDTPDPDDGYEEALTDPEDRSALKELEAVTYETYEDGPLADQEADDNVDITGFEYVRSDSAQITRDAQLQILTDILLADEPTERISEYLRGVIGDIEVGEVPLEDLGRPQGIGQHLDEYGWRDIEDIPDEDVTDDVREWDGMWYQRPGPTYRGAKYADDYFEWEDLETGGKPRKYPIETVRSGEYPAAYVYRKYPVHDRPDSPEVNDPVDAIAVEHPDRLPEAFVVDTETIIEKELEDKLTDILSTVGLSWADATTGTQQTGLDAFS